MNRTAIRDFFREIRKSRSRYLSILFMSALGVAFFTGVRASQPDMHLTADQLYDRVNYMDLRIMGTLGVTEEDRQAILAVEGVSDAEALSATEALVHTADAELVMEVMALPERITLPVVQEGRLPEQPDECLLDSWTAEQNGFRVGDRLRLEGDGADIGDTLTVTEYTVVGLGNSPFYLSFSRGSASIGNGSSDGVLYIPQAAFDTDYYTVIYARVQGAAEQVSYSEAYKDLIEPVREAVEAIADGRCEARYVSVKGEAEDEIADARQELAEAKADADRELSDALQELQDGEQELADARQELADGEQELADGRQELADGEKELKKQKDKLNSSWEQYYVGKEQLEDSEKEVNQALAQAAEAFGGGDQTPAKQAKLLKKQAAAAEKQISEQTAQLEEGKKQLAELQQQAAALGEYAPPELTEGIRTLSEQLTAGEQQLAAAGEQTAGLTALLAGYDQLLAGKAELEKSYDTLAKGQDEIDKGEAELADARQELLEAEQEIADAKQEIADGEQELADGWQEYYDGKAEADEEIADAEQKLAEAEADVADIEYPEWYVLDRESIQQYVEYSMDAERIGNLGKVFPAIFFLVAALVSLTTMTRMVEEDRTQIGTWKALGYGSGAIAGKYLTYAFSATLLGSGLGVAVGSVVLPYVIISAYKIMYINIPAPVMPVQVNYALISTGIAVLCTTAATWAACARTFREAPAQLMRPAAPKQGRRIFLERLPFLWNLFNFSWKSAIRNIVRYKKRFFMTVFGIGGCMALLMVGFGLRDSISRIVDNQYQSIWTYEAALTLEEDPAEYEAVRQLAEDQPDVTKLLRDYRVSRDVQKGNITKSAYVFVPEELTGLEDFVVFQDRITGAGYRLDGEGAIISEKLAKLLDVGPGDTFTLAETDTEHYEVRVAAVCENYLYHYVYMTPEYYASVLGRTPSYNELLLRLEPQTREREDEMASALLALEGVRSISFIRELQKTVANMMNSLNLVIWVLIISAGLLAYVVLYNLNNINITERRRELATLKVLGFYDLETAVYVYRENVILTLVGIGAGILMGRWLHGYVITTVEIDMIMFGQDIEPMSYLYSILMTLIFSGFVNLSMFYRLRRIDMIESLKSVE